MYKLSDGLPHYVRIYKQDLALNQDLPQNRASEGNLGPVKVGGINGAIEVIMRAHTDIAIDPGKHITALIQHSGNSEGDWSDLTKIDYVEQARTITKSGEVYIWKRRLPPVFHKTRLRITTNARFGGKIGAWYDHDQGALFHDKAVPDTTTALGEEEHFVNNHNGSTDIELYVMATDLSVAGEGDITMVLQVYYDENNKGWTDLLSSKYRLSAPDKIAAGTELGQNSLQTMKTALDQSMLF
ncbi:MAG: hypothetical protein FD153_11 [Rhodospirillaceae bacterium]|nr:MAG: hypothetical protein FD153_11 [Rhodospirillaceae bacterium]